MATTRPRMAQDHHRRAHPLRRILSAAAWIGIDVIVAVLVLTGWFSDDVTVRSLAYQSLATFVVWPMLVSALLSLGTGVLLGLGTKWGLLRYWWVTVKLVLNLVLCSMIVLVLQPGMGEVGTYGQDLVTGSPDPATVSMLFFPPAVSLTALAVATVLAVFKPWGRTGSRGDAPVPPRPRSVPVAAERSPARRPEPGSPRRSIPGR